MTVTGTTCGTQPGEYGTDGALNAIVVLIGIGWSLSDAEDRMIGIASQADLTLRHKSERISKKVAEVSEPRGLRSQPRSTTVAGRAAG